MRCERVRRRLLEEGPHASVPAVALHLESCAACARYAERWAAVRDGLVAHHAGIEPDPVFAARVRARLPGPVEQLGGAALRLLPAALALLLVVGWLAVTTAGPPEVVLAAVSSEDGLLGYLLTGELR